MPLYDFQPDYAIAPGETLRELLEERGMSQSELAVRTGLTEKTVSQIVTGTAPLTYETASKLEMVLGTPARFWNSLESQYRSVALRKEEAARLSGLAEWLKLIPVKELVARGHIEDTPDKGQLVHRVLRFFGVASVDAWNELWLKPQVRFRGSKAHESHPGFVAAWIRLGELATQETECAPYDRKAFLQAVRQIRDLTTLPAVEAFAKAQALCAGAGVALALVREIPGASVSGVARRLTKDRAIIVLSLKYKTDDQFWFSFFHEAAHILLHGKQLFVDDGMSEDSPEEIEANRFSREILIPPKYDRELPRLKSKIDIRRFAAAIGVSPGIVVGRLHREKLIPHGHCVDLKVKYEWA